MNIITKIAHYFLRNRDDRFAFVGDLQDRIGKLEQQMSHIHNCEDKPIIYCREDRDERSARRKQYGFIIQPPNEMEEKLAREFESGATIGGWPLPGGDGIAEIHTGEFEPEPTHAVAHNEEWEEEKI